jgi:hypothetical protein
MASCENFHTLKVCKADDEQVDSAFVCAGSRLLIATTDTENKLISIRGYTYEIIVSEKLINVTFNKYSYSYLC